MLIRTEICRDLTHEQKIVSRLHAYRYELYSCPRLYNLVTTLLVYFEIVARLYASTARYINLLRFQMSTACVSL
jgi:hypothetical protein